MCALALLSQALNPTTKTAALASTTAWGGYCATALPQACVPAFSAAVPGGAAFNLTYGATIQ